MKHIKQFYVVCDGDGGKFAGSFYTFEYRFHLAAIEEIYSTVNLGQVGCSFFSEN
jgi:hypothetical protein